MAKSISIILKTTQVVIEKIFIIKDNISLLLKSFFLNVNNFLNTPPQILQNFGLAVLTILIPLAIAILTDAYQKRRNKNNDFSIVDLHVILDSVFAIKWILFYIVVIYTCLFFWKTLPPFLHLYAFIIVVIALSLIIKTILNIYTWIKGNTMLFRISYMKKLRALEDMKECWRSIWSARDMNIYYEREFFKLFSSKINYLFEKHGEDEVLLTIETLLSDYMIYMKNRTTTFLTMLKEILCQTLDWYYRVWKKKTEHEEKI